MPTSQMEDPNLFLTLKAKIGSASAMVLRLPHNTERYIAHEPTDYDYGSRDTTPEPHPGEAAEATDQLSLRFDNPPIDPSKGFMFGTDEQECDVWFGDRKQQREISRHHFRIAFDEDYQLTLFDCHSAMGTSVSYDGFGDKYKRNLFKWLLLPGYKIKVHLPHGITFEIVIATHSSCEAEYRANLVSFLRLRGESVSPCEYKDSKVQSRLAPPKREPIYLPGHKLGEGSFGKVRIVTDVSTGVQYAAKEAKMGCEISLHREAQIMELASHVHIVRYHRFLEDGLPRLLMEYVPLGNLQDQHGRDPLSKAEICQLLVQALDALMHLHSQSKPITHRDIKPANILVQGRRDSFHIKLSDFGESKAMTLLKTVRGTPLYQAPEIGIVARQHGRGADLHQMESIFYDSKVDIWSLGVVILECLDRLPQRRGDFRQNIANCAATLARNEPGNPLLGLLNKMLQLNPSDRPSAAVCHEHATGFIQAYSIGVEADSADDSSYNTDPSDSNAKTIRAPRADENRTLMPHQPSVLGHDPSVQPNPLTASAGWTKGETHLLFGMSHKVRVMNMVDELRRRGVLKRDETESTVQIYVDILADQFGAMKIEQADIRTTRNNRVVIDGYRTGESFPFTLFDLPVSLLSVVDLYQDLLSRTSQQKNCYLQG
ncbi:hypothetical protein FQN53_001774 [Emmonsiellopsis sp. PD_33]|nr:hypothetical protein FQN53_001774 [Emmonsiellopsis sp. PD_33]